MHDKGIGGIAREVGFLAIGLGSLLWLLRTVFKPSRAAYPCQRAAIASASAWLGTLALPALGSAPLAAAGGGPLAAPAARTRVLAFLAAAVVIAMAAPSAADLLAAPGPPAGQLLPLKLAGARKAAPTWSDIFAVRGTNGADGGFDRLVRLMGEAGSSFYSLVGPGDVVIIKVNSQWDERGGTNTDLVRSIIESILRHPGGFSGEIVIADNGQGQFGSAWSGGSLDWKSSNAEDKGQSLQRVADRFTGRARVSTALWDRFTTTQVEEFSQGDTRDGYVVEAGASPRTGLVVSYPKFTTPFSTRISFKRGVWDDSARSYDSERLKVINVPVLKSHSIYGVTASVKHYMGVGSEKLTRSAHRSVGAGGMGTEMAGTRVPVLNIIDAIWINARPGGGPRTRYAEASRAGIIAASRDPAALDCWAARAILLPAARMAGYRDTDSLDPDVVRNGSFGSWLRLSMEELRRAGVPSTVDLDRVSITVEEMQ